MPVNVVHNVGATQVRLIVIGEEDREATPGEIRQMQALIAEAMDQGASGLSSALIYPPGLFQSTEELTELARAIKPYGGVYSTHMRNESSRLLEAIEEAITIGREAEVPVHIYHLKAAGLNNWPLMDLGLQFMLGRTLVRLVWKRQGCWFARCCQLGSILRSQL